jgi:hypothetical protein
MPYRPAPFTGYRKALYVYVRTTFNGAPAVVWGGYPPAGAGVASVNVPDPARWTGKRRVNVPYLGLPLKLQALFIGRIVWARALHRRRHALPCLSCYNPGPAPRPRDSRGRFAPLPDAPPVAYWQPPRPWNG